jgi:hypothetical protein
MCLVFDWEVKKASSEDVAPILPSRDLLSQPCYGSTITAAAGQEMNERTDHEHDDDLESTVHEGAEEETDAYPDTGDELEETEGDGGTSADADADEDESEL